MNVSPAALAKAPFEGVDAVAEVVPLAPAASVPVAVVPGVPVVVIWGG